MKKKPVVYIIWVVWYLCCLLLCQGAAPTGMAKVSTIVVGISAFAPPFYLLYLSKKDAKTIKLVQIPEVDIVDAAFTITLTATPAAPVVS